MKKICFIDKNWINFDPNGIMKPGKVFDAYLEALEDITVSIKQGIYRHFKGNKYHVLGVAQHSEDGSFMVVYRPMYGAKDLWVRPVEMFLETVELNGQQIPRFEFIEQVEQ